MNAPWLPRSLWSAACFDPGTAILGALSVLSTATSAVGAITAGQAQQQAAVYNAQVDRNNAIQAQDAANAQAIVSQQQTTQKIGAQQAAYGASGVDVNTGSPVDVMTNTAAQGRLDALTLRYGGKIKAQYDSDAATLATYQGSQAAAAGYLNAGNTLLTGATKLDDATGIFSSSAPSGGSPSGSSGYTPPVPGSMSGGLW